MSLERFDEKWGWVSADYPAVRVSEAELRSVEESFSVRLPEDYREAVLQVGLPRPTIALLDAIVERELDVHSVGDFFSPSEIIDETVGWHDIGMPEQLIAFASDGCGNKFCFDRNRLPDSSVWFFDHDFGTTEQIASSFGDWIDALCDVEPWPAP